MCKGKLLNRNFSSSPLSQKTLGSNIIDNNMVFAKVIGALKKVTSGYSNSLCNDIKESFRVMSPNSKITEDFKVGKTKMMYVTIALLYILNLSCLKKSLVYCPTFDESLSKVFQGCEMIKMV